MSAPNRVVRDLDEATAVRMAVQGRPEEGPYPATIGELADEVGAWIVGMESAAPGLASEVLNRLGYFTEAQAATSCPYYRGVGTCSGESGCGVRGEPSCVTDAPIGGWEPRLTGRFSDNDAERTAESF